MAEFYYATRDQKKEWINHYPPRITTFVDRGMFRRARSYDAYMRSRYRGLELRSHLQVTPVAEGLAFHLQEEKFIKGD